MKLMRLGIVQPAGPTHILCALVRQVLAFVQPDLLEHTLIALLQLELVQLGLMVHILCASVRQVLEFVRLALVEHIHIALVLLFLPLPLLKLMVGMVTLI